MCVRMFVERILVREWKGDYDLSVINMRLLTGFSHLTRVVFSLILYVFEP